jgi:hypothetical protein
MTATRRMARNVGLGALAAIGVVGLTGPPAHANFGLPEGHQPANLDPAGFTTKIDNPYYPLRPGDRRVYRETAPDGTRYKIVDVVTHRTKLIADGVTARVIRSRVTDSKGKVIEFTEEWFAQDRTGNVWYFGEDTTSYERSMPDKHGSFEAGVDGAERASICQRSPGRGCATGWRAATRPGPRTTQRCSASARNRWRPRTGTSARS